MRRKEQRVEQYEETKSSRKYDEENINILKVYEPRIDKNKLLDEIKESLKLYKLAQSQADKDAMVKTLIINKETLEQALKISYTSMQDLYDDKCDLEDENIVLKRKLVEIGELLEPM